MNGQGTGQRDAVNAGRPHNSMGGGSSVWHKEAVTDPTSTTIDTMYSIWGTNAAPTAATGASLSRVNRHEIAIEELTRRVDRLSLACQALWELLEDQGGLTETMLHHKITEVDLRDGQRDNKIARSIIVCPQCGNRCNSRRKQCIFCGAEVHGKHSFS